MPRLVRELDDACEPILEAAKEQGARVWVVSEYGHCDVAGVMFPNRVLRAGGFLEVRPGPFGELLDTFNSRAFAVCDHQLAHIYVKDPLDISPVRDLVAQIPSVGPLYSSEERAEIGLDHPRSGEIIALAKPNAWFAYPYWLDDRLAPDFARTVDIHRKPGFDPNELFVDPKIKLPALRIARRLLQKKLGFRTLFDVIPIDTFPVRGSHGLTAPDPQDKPLLIGDANSSLGSITRLTDVRDVLLNSMM
jgi:hypothetical protein